MGVRTGELASFCSSDSRPDRSSAPVAQQEQQVGDTDHALRVAAAQERPLKSAGNRSSFHPLPHAATGCARRRTTAPRGRSAFAAPARTGARPARQSPRRPTYGAGDPPMAQTTLVVPRPVYLLGNASVAAPGHGRRGLATDERRVGPVRPFPGREGARARGKSITRERRADPRCHIL